MTEYIRFETNEPSWNDEPKTSYNFHGKDTPLKLIEDTTLDNCKAECTKDDACIAFSYQHWRNDCKTRQIKPTSTNIRNNGFTQIYCKDTC